MQQYVNFVKGSEVYLKVYTPILGWLKRPLPGPLQGEGEVE